PNVWQLCRGLRLCRIRQPAAMTKGSEGAAATRPLHQRERKRRRWSSVINDLLGGYRSNSFTLSSSHAATSALLNLGLVGMSSTPGSKGSADGTSMILPVLIRT